jgi:hypothetical protein
MSDLILTPKIITTSASTGLFTWPPTRFTVDLTNTISTVNGKIITEPRVIGTVGANTSKKLSEYGIAGRRAIEDALLKTQMLLFDVKLPQKFESNMKVSSVGTISDRLEVLN